MNGSGAAVLVAERIEMFFLGYLVLLYGGYLAFDLIAYLWIPRHMARHALDELPRPYSRLASPISILVPARNEETTIKESVLSLLQTDYPEFEVIVINDGSTDRTLDVLTRAFALEPSPEAYRLRLPAQPIKEIYRSSTHPRLRVLDKVSGGKKADALNAAINASRYPLFCSIDADSLLQRGTLRQLARVFEEDPLTVAAGGSVRLVNGCQVVDGRLVKTRLPSNWLARFQVVEYLRSFLFARVGWARINALLVISGAFGIFRKETVIAAGGYRFDSVAEDMELVMRLHRFMRMQKKPYAVHFVPDSICWTQAPEDWRSLHYQRGRWQRGMCECMLLYKRLIFHPRAGAIGWLSIPHAFFTEMLSPVILAVGYLFTAIAWATGLLSLQVMLAFFLIDMGLGILVSVSALVLEVLLFRIYWRRRDLGLLSLIAVLENFGYRQIVALFSLSGVVQWCTGSHQWQLNKRKAFSGAGAGTPSP